MPTTKRAQVSCGPSTAGYATTSCSAGRSGLRTGLRLLVVGFITAFCVLTLGGPAQAAVTAGGATPNPGVVATSTSSGNGAQEQDNGNADSTDPNADPSTGANATGVEPPTASGGGANDATIETGVNSATSIFGQGAISAMDAALNRIGLWTTPDVQQPKGQPVNWFITQYRMLRVMALYLLMPLVLIAIIHAVAKGSLALLMKAVFLCLPISIIGAVVAVDIVQLLMKVVDSFCAIFINSIESDSTAFFTTVANNLSDENGIPNILDMAMGLLLAITCIFVYVTMVVREGSVYLATAFLPLSFALLVWPATAVHFKRGVEWLVGLILAKLVVVAIIALSIAALTAGMQGTGKVGGATLSANGGNFSTSTPSVAGFAPVKDGVINKVSNVGSAIAMMTIVLFATEYTIHLVGRMNLGDMATHVGNGFVRQSGLSILLLSDRLSGSAGKAQGLVQAWGRRAQSIDRAQGTHFLRRRQEAGGTYVDDAGNSHITAQMCIDNNLEPRLHSRVIAMSRSDNPDEVNQAWVALGMGYDCEGWVGESGPAGVPGTAGMPISARQRRFAAVLGSKTQQSQVVLNMTTEVNMGPLGRVRTLIRRYPRELLRQILRDEADRQIATSGGVGSVALRGFIESRVDGSARHGAATGNTTLEANLEEDASVAAAGVRGEYARSDGRPVPIYAQFRAPASIRTRMNAPLDANARQRVGGNV
jgi:hypothetical protein